MCLIGKVGKFLTQRWYTRECITGRIVLGTADQVIVAVTSLITKGRSEGPVGMVVIGEEGGTGDCLLVINSHETRVVSLTVCPEFLSSD